MTACTCGDCITCELRRMRSRVGPRLVTDERQSYVGEIGGVVVLLERRRANCARLAACEEAWIKEQGRGSNANAKCPSWCRFFQERAERVHDVSIGCSLNATTE